MKRTILIVEDNPITRKMMRVALEIAGYRVLEAGNGRTAIDLVATQPPDLVLQDLILPDMDGIELIRRFRSLSGSAAIPILSCSGYAAKMETAEAAQAGFTDFLLKPVQPSVLIQTVQAHLAAADGPKDLPVRGTRVLAVNDDDVEPYTKRLEQQLDKQIALNARLAHLLDLREAELTILAHLLETLQANSSPDSILSELLGRCLDAVGVRNGAAYLLGPDGGLSLQVEFGYPISSKPDLAAFFGHADLLRQVIKRGEPRNLAAGESPGDPENDLLRRAGAEWILIAPIAASDERLGVLFMASAERELGEHWNHFVKAVGAQIGQAIRLASALASLRDSQEHQARIVQTLAEGVLITDREGRFIAANAAAEEILGLPAEEILRRTHTDPAWKITALSGEPFDAENHPCTRAIRTGERVYNVELAIEHPSGRRVIVSANSAPLMDVMGEIMGAVTSLNDITKLAQSNAKLQEFAYVVAHDLKEPLRTVASYTQLLARRYKGKLDGQAHQFIDRALSGIERMQEMIDDLLAYARAGSRQSGLTPVDCEAVFRDCLANLHATIESSRGRVLLDPLPTVKADARELSQIFQNLISNALKFHGTKAPEIHVSAEHQGAEWLFSVADSGIGIDPSDAERIFQLFQRAPGDRPGSGIGLAICKKIVERYGGRIWVESEPGKGSKFCFTIPDAAPQGVTADA